MLDTSIMYIFSIYMISIIITFLYQ